MSKDLTIPFEVAHGITVASLQEDLSYLKKELKQYEKKGMWMHPEDAEYSRLHLIPALKVVLKYYGHSNKD